MFMKHFSSYLQSRRRGYEVNSLNALARPSDSIALYWSAAVAKAMKHSSAEERFNLWIAEVEREMASDEKHENIAF